MGVAGPILLRDLLTTPRRPRHYVMRGLYAGLLFILLATAWQAILGFQQFQPLADVALFNANIFPLFAYVQLALVLFAASLYGANAISHEKDRRTFVLLLVTRLSDTEIVRDKFLSAVLQVAVGLLAAAPVFFLSALLGGVAPGQIVALGLVTAGAALVAAATGTLIATWREKTFQSVALTMLAVSLALLAVEVIAAAGGDRNVGDKPLADWLALVSPVRAIGNVTNPSSSRLVDLVGPSLVYFTVAVFGAGLLLTTAIVGLRRWNPRGEPIQQPDSLIKRQEGATAAPVKDSARPVWSNPVLWREIRTRAYGTRPVLVKAGYALVVAILLVGLWQSEPPSDPRLAIGVARYLLPVCVLSLLLVNTQSVTSVTSERDIKAIDLLLATDLSPREFLFGKLAGVAFNAKEFLVAPVIGFALAAARGWMAPAGVAYATVALTVFFAFAAVLGIHHALRYESTRVCLAHSLGTMFLLFVGILFCLFLILISGQFEAQWGSFIVFIVLGSIGLWVSLSANAPSNALAVTASMLPAATFYCLVAFLVGDRVAPFLVGTGAYGFAVAALMVPLLAEFDVATGRTSADGG